MIQTILSYFKYEEKENEDTKLVLIDIEATSKANSRIICVKKDMYEEDLKYIAISYRWGEFYEQLENLPDYIAHVSSFFLLDFIALCQYIQYEPDLKEIPYLWIDTISIDQKNHSKKKEVILIMNQIYEKASYILAVPDLHIRYLLNTDLFETLALVCKYHDIIYENILNNHHHHNHINNNNSILNTTTTINQNKVINEEELKKLYQLLAYLIEDWSNRTWVINECHIAKKKYKQHGTPLKYIFLCLIFRVHPDSHSSFFSYSFDDDGDNQQQRHTKNNDDKLTYKDVNDHKKLIQFIKIKLNQQRSHLDIILNSNATRNEDRFHAILPSWDKYKSIIQNKNTISEWNITDMTSVRLKLYEIMDNGLWDKATLLYACSQHHPRDITYPSFASHHHHINGLELNEKDNINVAYETYESILLKDVTNKEEINRIKQLINDEYKMNSKPIWIENLTSIQLNKHHHHHHHHHQHQHYLSVKSNTYFILEIVKWDMKDSLSEKLLVDYVANPTHYVYIPFFTFAIPKYAHIRTQFGASGIYLIGDININKWVLYSYYASENFTSKHICSNGYTFNIY